jgi:hypothetical protein
MLPLLNRSAVMVRPKAPYIAWAQSVHEDEEMTPEQIETALLEDEPTLYLVPACEEDEEIVETLNDFSELIFEEELEAWSTDPETWPTDRSFEVFQEWFEIMVVRGVVDTVDEEADA